MSSTALRIPAPTPKVPTLPVRPPTARPRVPLHSLRPIGVIVVDDHPVMLRGLSGLLAAEPGIEVLAGVADSRQALEVVTRLTPEIVVVDFHMLGENGLELACRLGSLPAAPRVVVYSAFPGVSLVAGATVAGAYAVISKSALPSELIDAIHAAHNGRRTIPAVSRSELAALTTQLRPVDRPLLGMFEHGIPPEQIARTFGLSESELLVRRQEIVRVLSDPSEVTLRSLSGGALHYSHSGRARR
ncbi:MAG TPA: response regulator transcription factor [Solirubrobacteraceae bacterium]